MMKVVQEPFRQDIPPFRQVAAVVIGEVDAVSAFEMPTRPGIFLAATGSEVADRVELCLFDDNKETRFAAVSGWTETNEKEYRAGETIDIESRLWTVLGAAEKDLPPELTRHRFVLCGRTAFRQKRNGIPKGTPTQGSRAHKEQEEEFLRRHQI